MNKKQYPNTIGQSVMIVLMMFLYASPLVFLERKYFDSNSNSLRVAIIFFIASIFTILTVLFINSKRGIQISNFNIKLRGKKSLLILIILLILFQILFNKPFSNYINLLSNSDVILKNPFQNIGLTIGALLIAPILEEIIFRKIILGGLLKKYSKQKSIIISSLLFAIMHLHFSQFFGALIIGLYLGWVFYQTKSLGNVIFLHFTANVSAFCLGLINYKFGDTSLIKIYGAHSKYIFAISLLILFYLIFYIKRNKEFLINKLRN